MERTIMEELRRWYELQDGRILFICGAPCVGKTWLIDKLCKEKSDRCIRLSALHYQSRYCKEDVRDLVKNHNEHTGTFDNFIKKANMLIVCDVNDEKALNIARKIVLRIRMEELLPDFKIIMEGSVIDKSFFTKYFIDDEYVKVLRVYPMSFQEFKSSMSRKYEQNNYNMLKMYLITGGMPECVSYFMETGDFTGVRRIQKDILKRICLGKTSKYKAILESIPRQLNSNSGGFSYRQINKNAREREYGATIDALEKHGLIYRVRRIDKENISAMKNCKLYANDVGMTGALMGISERLVMDDNRLLQTCNELLVKSFIVAEFHALGMSKVFTISYWHKSRAKAKLPLILLERHKDIIMLLDLWCGKHYDKSIVSFMELHKVDRIYRLHNGTQYSMKFDVSKSKNIYDDVLLCDIHKLFVDAKNIIKQNKYE